MPESKYIKVLIDDQPMELASADQLPVSISYKLEDTADFQKKQSSEAFSITFPATPANDKVGNTFHNPAVEDLTSGEVFKSLRKAVIEANGYELLVGKALLTEAVHNSRPVSYQYDFYGNNGDWIIGLNETTLYDLVKQINFTFSKANIIASWAYDGRSESLPYVFAPVRYVDVFDDGLNVLISTNPPTVKDYNMKPEYMKPAISKYFLIYWGFKLLGYQVKSDFFDTDYFRRQVMPWTWGNFLFSEGTRLNNLDFLAKSVSSIYVNYSDTGIYDLLVSNDSTDGGFDNNGVYSYDATAKEMKWTYPPAFNYGTLEATFHLQVQADATVSASSDVELRVQYFKNGVRVMSHDDNGNGTELVIISAPSVGRRDFVGIAEDSFTIIVSPTDVISARFYLHTFDSGLGRANILVSVLSFELDYFRIPLNGTIDFSNYTGFQKFPFLDYLRGVIDEFNLSVQTDSINKVVCIEPTHPYSLSDDLSATQGGYFNGNVLDWKAKQDLSKNSPMKLYSDYDREVTFKYKDDSADGIVKIVQDRNLNTLGAGKYVFPNRFKSTKRDVENRFFSSTIHYEVDQWRGLGTDAGASPQMICLVPENVSNTSASEAQNTFAPKSVYYKGLVTNVGWVFDGDHKTDYPYLFAVNYQAGGENDPILSYCDERIGTFPSAELGKGLLRRFFLQRLAIMRNGQFYTTSFRLNNMDVTNWYHREHIICRGQRFELVEINDYKPLLEASTECSLRKWSPIAAADGAAVYPAANQVMQVSNIINSFDIRYSPLKALYSDIPTE